MEGISCVQKKEGTFQDLIETVTNARLSSLGKVKTNRPHASQIGVIIVLSIKMQALCDALIGRELNEIRPTANGRLDIFDFMTNPGASD